MRFPPTAARAFLLALALATGSLVAQAAEAGAPGAVTPARPDEALRIESALRERLGAPMETLDLDLVMFGPDFFGTKPTEVRFEPSGRRLVFRWKRWNEEEARWFTFDFESGWLRRQPAEFTPPSPPEWDREHRRCLRIEGEALVLEHPEHGERRELLRVAGGPSSPGFSVDGAVVRFGTSEGLFELRLDPPSLRQLLAFRRDPGTAPEAKEEKKPEEDLAAWHADQQQRLFRRLFEQGEERERSEEQRRARYRAQPSVTSYEAPRGWRRGRVSVSPAGTHAAISLREEKGEPRGTEMPDYVTRDGYVRTQATRPKVGDATGRRRLQVVDLASGAVVEVAELEPERGAWPVRPRWTPDGRWLLADVRTDDDETLALLRIDPVTGERLVLHRVDDPAWVPWSWGGERFLGGSSRAVFLSEASGWSHLWRVDVDGGECVQLTRGEFEMSSPCVTPDGRRVYALATVTSPHVKDVVAIDPEDGAMTLVSAERGGREITLSPDGTRLAEVFSAGNRPWELAVRDLEGVAPLIVVTDSPSPAFKSWSGWEDPPIVRIPAGDGASVPARIYRPAKPLPGRPAVLFVHGAGYLQNVHRWWSHYEREYAFHHLLRQQGYLVLDVDYRGSAGYGRDWRCAIHGHMGGRDLDDFVDAARWLVRAEGVDPGRIGIYGGSYGGFITLMALFTRPGVFAAGAALRPVTDWAHYNDGYTSNILNDPLETPETYARSSPIHFAGGLRDHLLICHGLLDSNVHVQGVFRLQQRLIELRKRNWEVALYPLEGHGFTDAASWSDEYRRIHALFDRVLLR